MASFHPGFQSSAQDAFKGDHELFLDRLVVSSQKKHVEDKQLLERQLVPFFESSNSSKASYEPLERVARKSLPAHGHGLKRNAGERSGNNLASTPSKKDPQTRQGKHRRGAKSQGVKPQGPQANSDSEVSTSTFVRIGSSDSASSPLRPQQKHTPTATLGDMGMASSPPSPLNSEEHCSSLNADYNKFAGPAFCNSPTPDCLPIPTTSLLMQEAADSLQSQLML